MFFLQLVPSFPTRRSSDLACPQLLCKLLIERIEISYHNSRSTTIAQSSGGPTIRGDNHICAGNGFIESFPWFERASREDDRSEEHTSELQSRFDLVCSLLL